jgi:hypothetical protein
MAKSRHEYTIKELEQIVFNRSLCYTNSEAFQMCLDFIKQVNYPMYKDMLYKEANACGGLD